MNFFNDLPNANAGEVIEEITTFAKGAVRIERIISGGHSSEEGFWYEQDDDEWVLLIRGSARLLIEGRGEALAMKAGDPIELPAKLRHRVDFASEDALWLAVHVSSSSG